MHVFVTGLLAKRKRIIEKINRRESVAPGLVITIVVVVIGQNAMMSAMGDGLQYSPVTRMNRHG